MRIQQTNSPKMQELSTETTQESSSSRAVAKQNQKDVFEAVTSSQQQVSLFKRDKFEVEAAIKNVEMLAPPILGSPIETYLSMGKGDRMETGKDASSQQESLASQESMQELAKATKDKSDSSASLHSLLNKIIDSNR